MILFLIFAFSSGGPLVFDSLLDSETIARHSNCESNYSMPMTSLVDLTMYHNGQSGVKSDHYLTTIPSSDPSLEGYSPQSVFAKILVDPEGCDCLVRLVQMFDHRGDTLGRYDHKLAKDGEEDDRLFEQYDTLDEVVYCAQKHACGATIPLYKQFNVLDLDSTYSTDNVTLPFSEVYPTKPLCYVWPTDYSFTPPPDVANVDNTVQSATEEEQIITEIPPTEKPPQEETLTAEEPSEKDSEKAEKGREVGQENTEEPKTEEKPTEEIEEVAKQENEASAKEESDKTTSNSNQEKESPQETSENESSTSNNMKKSDLEKENINEQESPEKTNDEESSKTKNSKESDPEKENTAEPVEEAKGENDRNEESSNTNAAARTGGKAAHAFVYWARRKRQANWNVNQSTTSTFSTPAATLPIEEDNQFVHEQKRLESNDPWTPSDLISPYYESEKIDAKLEESNSHVTSYSFFPNFLPCILWAFLTW